MRTSSRSGCPNTFKTGLLISGMENRSNPFMSQNDRDSVMETIRRPSGVEISNVLHVTGSMNGGKAGITVGESESISMWSVKMRQVFTGEFA